MDGPLNYYRNSEHRFKGEKGECTSTIPAPQLLAPCLCVTGNLAASGSPSYTRQSVLATLEYTRAILQKEGDVPRRRKVA